MTTTPAGELPPLPSPWDYCYEWNGPYGARKFSAASHNGRACDKQVPVFTADQLRAYGELCATERDWAWTLALTKALGPDSRLPCPIAPDADAFRKLFAALAAQAQVAVPATISCSQCGREFGPGQRGFSHCDNHIGMAPL